MTDIHAQKILILDFGSQYTQLIARRVREAGVYCEILPFNVTDAQIQAFDPKGVILSGGPESVTGDNTPRVSQSIFELGCPVLGICYGMQTMAAQLGGEVENAEHHEYGHAQITVDTSNALFEGLQDELHENGKPALNVWMSHGDRVLKTPEGFICIASSTNAPIAAFANEDKQFYGIQFHPEVTHTTQGEAIYRRFLKDICQCDGLWTPGNIIDDAVEAIKTQVGNDKVILGLSGGVDSAVTAALIHKAIGNQLTCIFVDNGLLRQNEAEQVMSTFQANLGIPIIKADAQDQFLSALKGVKDPEEKRKIAGNSFIHVFEAQANALSDVKWLAQGTIYPDVIESGANATGNAHVIKSHHNVGGLPERMNLKLLEPLRELFKDEVRKIGLALGLPQEMIGRHPFPGPGLALRVLEDVKPAYLDLLRQADAIFIEELRAENLYDKVSQAFVVFLPIKSVGVQGDGRCYDYVVSLRAVETIDFMTARWAHLPYTFLEKVSGRIINEVKGISRVVYDISSKPPATIEWE